MKLPIPKFKFTLPKFFQLKVGELKPKAFYKIWKRFRNQIPREFRSVTNQHQHFIVLGEEKSGKTELIQGIIEQSQNIYPFEVEYTSDLNVQFYLGPKQLVQELSLSVVKDRTIAARKSLIYLWKQLFSKNPPIIVITYNCWSDTAKDSREVSKIARTLAGKLSLLSEITKEPLKIRIALTHLDKIPGYIEFASFIKQQNLVFEIPIESNFESHVLQRALGSFRDKYLSLILTSVSADDFLKILAFFDELPKLFVEVEEFLRALITGNISGQLELEKLTFTTKVEPYTAFSSFDWASTGPGSIFFRHPMLKHQIASAAVFGICSGLVLNNCLQDRLQLKLTMRGIDSLVYLQPKVLLDEVIPRMEHLNHIKVQMGYLPFLPHFYREELREARQQLATKIQKQILESSLRKIMLQDQSELKVLYMLGLIHATEQNRLGHHILKNLSDWASALQLDEQLIKRFICCNTEDSSRRIEMDNLDKINPVLPLTSPAPWIDFLTRFQDLANQPVFIGHNFENLRSEAARLLGEYRRMKNDTHASVLCSLIKEVPAKMLSDFGRNIYILKWLGQNSDYVESFLVFVCQTCPAIPDITDHNVSQFFAKIKDIVSLNEQENRSYNFLLGDEKFAFQTLKWVNLSVAHVIERLMQNYIVSNNDTQGNIFFKNTPVLPDLVLQSYRNEFPYFIEPIVIPGRYTRLAFEKNVRHTSESLLKLLEALPINMEDKERFTMFIQKEVFSYAKQYQKEYERLYAACNIRSTTLEEVKEMLEKILEPTSAFHYFLTTLNYNTEVFSDPPACLSALKEVNHFNFLRSLMSQVKNKSSPFEQYQGLIKQVLFQLRVGNEMKNFMAAAQLEDVLTPSARVTLSILRNDSDSFLNQINENLNQIGVPPNYHHLFTAPIMQIYRVGIKDLKKAIEKLWASSLEPEINTLFSKRPFNPASTMVSTFEEVRKITNPRGEIIGIIKQIVAPVSTLADGTWIQNPASDVQLDPAIYTVVNRLSKVSEILWDSEGNPKPLQLNVQSLPFESAQPGALTPILSYLVTGEETFHNFNQSPTWHPIKIEWWKENSSTVVLELATKSDNRSYHDEKVLNTSWSFFELLKKAEEKEKNVWQWKLGNLVGEKVSQISLKFETNPWELFQYQTQSPTEIANIYE